MPNIGAQEQVTQSTAAFAKPTSAQDTMDAICLTEMDMRILLLNETGLFGPAQ